MLKLAGLTLAALTLSTAAHADVGLKLGSTERVTRLFEQRAAIARALIENGGHGSTAAAPAALKVFEEYFDVGTAQQVQCFGFGDGCVGCVGGSGSSGRHGVSRSGRWSP